MNVSSEQRKDLAQEKWTAVDGYITDHLFQPDPTLDAVIESSQAAGLPLIQVSATQGKMLHILARVQGARRILELGTLGGYSTIWLARALPPDGRLVTLEANPKHADVARANLARAGLSPIVELRLGPALDSLKEMAHSATAAFDLIFIDADKPSYADYLTWCLKLCRPGTLVVADNVVRKGNVVDENSDDVNVRGIRRFNEVLAAEPRLIATTIQTVGSKGYDGFTMAVMS